MPADFLRHLGAVATRTELPFTDAELRTAVRRERIVRLRRGVYALPGIDRAVTEAAQVNGVVSHLSAALLLGLKVAHAPESAQVTVPRNRRLSQRPDCQLSYRRLLAGDAHARVTSLERTLIDCAQDLPGLEALAVWDSALHQRRIHPGALDRLPVRGARARLVQSRADGRADNPFESVLRWLALEAGLEVIPQYPLVVGSVYRVADLVDPTRRVIIEADSFEWHGSRQALAKDAHRYNDFVCDGWTVVRCAYEHVMFEPRQCLVWLHGLAQRPAQYSCGMTSGDQVATAG